MVETLLDYYDDFLKTHGFEIPGELIAFDDAAVFKVETGNDIQAWKLYSEGFTFRDIEKYKILTNKLARLNNGDQAIIQSLDGSVQFPFSWQFVPVDEVREINGCPCTISQFIEGPTMWEFVNTTSCNNHPLLTIHEQDSDGINAQLEYLSRPFNRGLSEPVVKINSTNSKVMGDSIYITDISYNVSFIVGVSLE